MPRISSTAGNNLVNLNTVFPRYDFSAAASIDEGSALSVTVNTFDVYSGTVLYWSAGNAGDFSVSQGSVTITNGTASFSLTPSADGATEGAESFTLTLRTGSQSGPIVATSGSITINDTSATPAFTSIPVSIDEGSAGTFTVNNLGPAGTYYWTINTSATSVPFDGGAANSSDFAAVSGSFTTATTNGTGTFTVTPIFDYLTENNGVEDFRVEIRQGSVSGTVLVISDYVFVNERSGGVRVTSPGFTYSENGGAALIQADSASGKFPNGTYYWTILNGTTTNADFVSTSGSFTVTNSTSAQFNISFTTGDGAEAQETFQIQIRTGSTSGTVISTSPTFRLNSTS